MSCITVLYYTVTQLLANDLCLLFPFLGMGFAFLYQACSVVTALYFRNRLATAYSIGRSGMGLTFALAPFTQLLLDKYAWQGRWNRFFIIFPFLLRLS